MTIEEFRAACAQSRAHRVECGLDPDDARLVLVVPGKPRRRGPFGRKRVLPGRCGVWGSVVGHTDRGAIVDVAVADIERWLKWAERTGYKL